MSLIRICRASITYFGPGDILVLFAFVLLGEVSHGAMPWAVPLMVAETVGTFVVGWVAVAPLVWAYQRTNLSSETGAALTGFVAWAGAAAIANLIRSTDLVHGNASLSFFLVAVVVGGAMMGGWRYLRVRSILGSE